VILIQLILLLLVAASGTAVVFTRDPAVQPIGISYFGLILALMFMAFQAPDVALSQIVIGTVGLPLMILLALARMRRDAQIREQSRQRSQDGGSPR
jgi:uncharacterized MnhB-related membrane protein